MFVGASGGDCLDLSRQISTPRNKCLAKTKFETVAVQKFYLGSHYMNAKLNFDVMLDHLAAIDRVSLVAH